MATKVKNYAKEERRALASCKTMLVESKIMGIATAEELRRQGEQLKKTEKDFDKIETSLETTQKNLIKLRRKWYSYSNVKSYFSKKSKQPPAENKSNVHTVISIDKESYIKEAKKKKLPQVACAELKLQGAGKDPQVSYQTQDELDITWGEIDATLKTLRDLAEDMGEEVTDQNKLIDRISIKNEKAEITIEQQNKEMCRMLIKTVKK